MPTKINFDAVYGHQEVSPAPEAPTAAPTLDFSKIAGWRQESPTPNPEATTLGKVTKDVQSILREDAEAKGQQPATVSWESLHPAEE